MKVEKINAAAMKLLTEAAGADAKLSKTEAKKLPAYMQLRVEAARTSPSAKVSVQDAFSSVIAGVTRGSTVLSGLAEDLFNAQRDPTTSAVKLASDVSKAERARITEPTLKAATDLLWSVAEATDVATPVVAGPALTNKQLTAAATLLTSILNKADNGDDVMTAVEVRLADIRFKGAADPVASGALTNAVNRAKNDGSREISGIAKAIADALKETLGAKKPQTVLGKALVAFAQAHNGDKLSDFATTPEKIYVPTRPFKAPNHASPEEFVTALATHVNAFSNDNKSGSQSTRLVMGAVETSGMAREIEKLSPAYAKAVLKALEARIQLPKDYLGDPKRIYLTAEGQALMAAAGKRVGGSYNFVGIAAPPAFNYY